MVGNKVAVAGIVVALDVTDGPGIGETVVGIVTE